MSSLNCTEALPSGRNAKGVCIGSGPEHERRAVLMSTVALWYSGQVISLQAGSIPAEARRVATLFFLRLCS